MSLFQSATFYSTGTGSSIKAVAVTDLNGDGKPDVVATDSATGVVDVLLGDGSGGFTLAGSYAAGTPTQVAVGDLNGDGHPDVVVTSGAAIGVLLGNGSGGLSAATFTTLIPSYPQYSILLAVAIADVNGDGRLDVLTLDSNRSRGELRISLGDGTGGFTQSVFGGTSVGPSSFTVADLNGDGKPDVVSADGGSLDVGLNNGNGGFSQGGNFAPNVPEVVAVGDLNGDGILDLVTVNGVNLVNVYLGKGGGTFFDETAYPAFAVTPPSSLPVLVDLNGDGKLDLVAVAAATSEPFVLLGNGTGGFLAPSSYDLGRPVSSVVAADVNGDGRPDLVFAAGTGVEVVLTPACFCPGTRIGTPVGEVAVEALAIGDPVVTVSGAVRVVRWVGRRSYNRRFAARNPALWPVRFAAGSLGNGVPARELVVSGEHAMLLDGVLVPAKHLVNGATVVREPPRDDVHYLHIELDSHDAILAEGAPSESFVDDDSRGMFHNAAEWHAMYPGRERLPAVFCAPRVESGPELEAIRRRLGDVAGGVALAA